MTNPKPQARPVFRHELKYYLNEGDAYLLETRLNLTMRRDNNCGSNSGYHIRSLYFDDVYNSAMQTKLDGVDERKKYRIRIYNLSDRVIKLECKHKKGTYIHKTACAIDRQTADALVARDPTPLLRYDSPLAREVYQKMRTVLLAPVVIVDYVREPFVSPFQDVRITLDMDLRTGLSSTDLFDRSLPTVPALENDETVLEIKFNDHLPEYFRTLLLSINAQRCAISKYCICRKYE